MSVFLSFWESVCKMISQTKFVRFSAAFKF